MEFSYLMFGPGGPAFSGFIIQMCFSSSVKGHFADIKGRLFEHMDVLKFGLTTLNAIGNISCPLVLLPCCPLV
jgi:hypothetical protein